MWLGPAAEDSLSSLYATLLRITTMQTIGPDTTMIPESSDFGKHYVSYSNSRMGSEY
jgi:hypothetical protein